MDEETRACLEAMEARVMGRMHDNQERTLERMRGLDTAVAALTELARSANTLMAAIAASLTDIAGRVTRLEGKS